MIQTVPVGRGTGAVQPGDPPQVRCHRTPGRSQRRCSSVGPHLAPAVAPVPTVTAIDSAAVGLEIA